MNIRTIFLTTIILTLTACSRGAFDRDENFFDSGYYPIPDAVDGGDSFDEIKENGFIRTSEQNVSTFSVDADGAAYAYMRRSIASGWMPTPNAVRIEEYLNYFTYDYPEPVGDESVSINGEIGDCPWNTNHKLMRLGIKGRTIPQDEMPDANYVFLIDVSGSMNSSDKLPLLKTGLKTLTDYLRPTDRISIVTYSGKAEMLLESTLASDAETIKTAISKLVASGSTAGGQAMKMAYEEALANYIEGGNNRVIMGTDGDFNVGVTSTDELLEMVQDYASKGIYITVCGFGTGNLNDSMMEKISNEGNGTYEYIDCEDELTKVFVNERSKFFSVANDAKVQVTFNPELIESYRLIGYENRSLSNEDFGNDRKDAGEIGAGQTITALYEIVPASSYDDRKSPARFDFRYKKALSEASRPLSVDIPASRSASYTEFDFAAGVAAYGMLLRNSEYKGDASFSMVRGLVESGLSFDPYGYRKAFLDIVETAESISR